MALQQRVQLESGVELYNAYIQVTRMDLDYYRDRAEITICVFMDEEARREGKSPVKEENISITDREGIPPESASYLLDLRGALEGSLREFSLTLPGEDPVVLREGTHFTGGELDTEDNPMEIAYMLEQLLVTAEPFLERWNVQSTETQQLAITAVTPGAHDTSPSVDGQIIRGLSVVNPGLDEIKGYYTYYFRNTLDADNSHPLYHAYEYLKTMDRFANATDLVDDRMDPITEGYNHG